MSCKYKRENEKEKIIGGCNSGIGCRVQFQNETGIQLQPGKLFSLCTSDTIITTGVSLICLQRRMLILDAADPYAFHMFVCRRRVFTF